MIKRKSCMKTSTMKRKSGIKTGVKVYVSSGINRGQIGVVEKVLTKSCRVIVSGCKTHTKRLRDPKGEKGSVVKKPAPIHISNICLFKTKY